ncbi:MAG: two-component system sensor histidine kinase GacS [Thiohalomonadaceae bacterium]
MKNWSITRKVLLLALVPGTVIALVLSVYFTSLQLRALDRALRDEGSVLAAQFAPASEYGVVSGNQEMLARLATSMLQHDDVVWIGVRDTEGVVYQQVGQVRFDWHNIATRPDADGVCAESPQSLLFCAPIRKTRLQVSDFPEAAEANGGSDIIGWVFVEMSTEANARRRIEVIAQSLVLTSVLLFITSLFAIYIGYQISRPIIAMTETVQKVARGNLDVRTQITGGGEINSLAQGINGMIASLASGRDEMLRRIDHATAQLRETLSSLEQKNLALDEERLRAQAASHAKGQFLANMSHEIRTPLSGIIGMLALLEKTDLQPNQRAYVTNLSLAADALHTLLNDILDLSRIEAGKLQLLEQTFSPRQLLDEVALMLASSAHEKGLDLICHSAADIPEQVRGDSLRLRQVLINLVSNAIKFTESGSVVVRAFPLPAESAPDARSWVRFEVEDSGIGIPADRQQSIFDSFTQIDSSNTRRYSGSGLGTTIARELVQLMGGRIGLFSAEGQGSLFWFELPWVVETAVAAVDVPAWHGLSLVIVQQDNEGRRALQDLALRLGLNVQATADGAAVAGLIAASTPPVLVLLVEHSREASWLELARQLRGQKATAQALLCHVTFFNGDSDAGLFDSQMNKPVTLESLRDSLQALLQQQPGTSTARNGMALPVVSPAAIQRRVLVAEDNRINALVIRSFLEQAGHRVVWVENGADALTMLARGHFDLVLMDMRMPQVDGLEATRRWRMEEPAGQRIPIVALTANATVEDRERCLAAGMDAFLSKPVEQEQLLALLERLGS